MNDPQDVEAARHFEQFVLGDFDRLKAHGYNPTLFRRLVAERGSAVNAAKLLLGSGRHTSYGFERLWEMGELEMSIEFAVCLLWFRTLFTVEEQEEAETRLRLHDFPLDRRLRAAEMAPPSWVSA